MVVRVVPNSLDVTLALLFVHHYAVILAQEREQRHAISKYVLIDVICMTVPLVRGSDGNDQAA